MRRLYEGQPDDDKLASVGLKKSDIPPDPPFKIWPDNWQQFVLFSRMQTQWRVGMGGAIGLDYNVVFHELDRKNLAKADYDDFFNAIQIMEVEALKVMREKSS